MQELLKPCGDCGVPVNEVTAYLGMGGQLCGACAAYRIQREEEARDTKQCPKCGKATRRWSRALWRDYLEYCKPCVKELEEVWQAKNGCMACSEIVEDWSARIYPPERIQARDEWVKSGKVEKRFVCRKCFEAMTQRKFGVFVRRNQNAQTPLLRRMSSLLGVG